MQFNVNIEDKELISAFRRFVVTKHGKLHTVLGQELERAMKRHLKAEYDEILERESYRVDIVPVNANEDIARGYS